MFDETLESLKKEILYDKVSGSFFRISTNKFVESKRNARYLTLRMSNNKTYYAHRLAWLNEYGEFPRECIDHIDGDTRNNKISNLRSCSHSNNLMNRGPQVNNKTGYIGVFEKRGKYVAAIEVGKKKIHIGYFLTAELASEAYIKYAKKYHSGFVDRKLG